MDLMENIYCMDLPYILGLKVLLLTNCELVKFNVICNSNVRDKGRRRARKLNRVLVFMYRIIIFRNGPKHN